MLLAAVRIRGRCTVPGPEWAGEMRSEAAAGVLVPSPPVRTLPPTPSRSPGSSSGLYALGCMLGSWGEFYNPKLSGESSPIGNLAATGTIQLSLSGAIP